jgi:hypothetical protein
VEAHQLPGGNDPFYHKHPAHTTQIELNTRSATLVLPFTGHFYVALDKPHGLSIQSLPPGSRTTVRAPGLRDASFVARAYTS